MIWPDSNGQLLTRQDNNDLSTLTIWLLMLTVERASGSSSVVEHHLAKVRVASSNLVFRSI